ncbi:telomere-protecting terminal protein Tpg [Streptomyces sp. NPDC059752]|uniref:telomere-protecting terminal protein Tpg n=1 Tax=unclassified Streptomyces TaxID=2593676 RepID=UPI00366824A0
MAQLGDGLNQGVQKAFTRPIPKSAPAQMRHLVKQLKSTEAAAAALGITQRTVERYVKGQIKKPCRELANRMEREVKKRWLPQIRAKAKKAAATTGGIVVDTRARFGYTAAPGTTDDGRLRQLTVALPPEFAGCLFDAQDAGASEQQLRDIAAEGLQEIYFKDRRRRAGGLLVAFTDIDHIEFDL